MIEEDKEFFNFIQENLNRDPIALRLSVKKDFYPFNVQEAINQIEYRKKYSLKLKSFLDNPFFLFPDYLSGQQASHQAVANFHSSIMTEKKNILDMTAGLGIDALSFAKKGSDVTAVELNDKKAITLKKNAETLKLSNIKIINDDSIHFLSSSDIHFDIIFVDPSRRNENLQRVYNFKDCSPDIITFQELLIKKSDKIFIKASPLLDISQTLKDFHSICSISAIGVMGECKELLIEINSQRNYEDITLKAINLDKIGNVLSDFTLTVKNRNDYHFTSNNKIATLKDLERGNYLLEPSAMIMKLAPWNTLCEKYNAVKLGKSSHLFISKLKPFDFPGRVTEIEKIITKKDRKSLIGFPASVVSKNHPLSSEDLRKSFKIKEGDDNFLYASRLGDKPIIVLTKKI